MLVRFVSKEAPMKKIIMFYARECPHCRVMLPLVDRLEKETGITFERLEVWHDEKNADLMRSYRHILAPACGGQLRTPTFFQPESQAILCGEVPYERLKAWAEEALSLKA
jgi:thiol-disulfide isomerase/thioredoxin